MAGASTSKKEKAPLRKKANGHAIPADWEITEGDERYAYAVECGLTSQEIEIEEGKFIGHFKGNGKLMVDFDGCWQRWCRTAQTYKIERQR